MKKLKIWNGLLMLKAKYEAPTRQTPVYVCAYSVADVMVLLDTYSRCKITRSEISGYWSAGCWGTAMNGIAQERGVWVEFTPGKVTRLV